MTTNNSLFILALFALLTIVSLSVVTIYNYISCLTLKHIYDDILKKQENELNNKLNNELKGAQQLILEDKVTNTKSSNTGTIIKRTPRSYNKTINKKTNTAKK